MYLPVSLMDFNFYSDGSKFFIVSQSLVIVIEDMRVIKMFNHEVILEFYP